MGAWSKPPNTGPPPARLRARWRTGPAEFFLYDGWRLILVIEMNCGETTCKCTCGSDWQLTESLYFIYEDWKVVLVMDAVAGTVLRKYTWGWTLDTPCDSVAPERACVDGASRVDLSGTLNGAGGVGGVLACYDTNGTAGTTADDKRYWFLHDAQPLTRRAGKARWPAAGHKCVRRRVKGYGNVSQILKFTPDPAAATLAAHYEYDPYGNTVTVNDVDSSGVAQANPFRFSTKWLDDDLAAAGQNGAIGATGLYYYGYRYYSPHLGRWLDRDPIEEAGGLNVYAFVFNSPIIAIDPLGHEWSASPLYWWCPLVRPLFYGHNVPKCRGGRPSIRLCIDNLAKAARIARDMIGRYAYVHVCHGGFDPTGADGHSAQIRQRQIMLGNCGGHIKQTCDCRRARRPVAVPVPQSVPAPAPVPVPPPPAPKRWYQHAYDGIRWGAQATASAAAATGEWIVEHPIETGTIAGLVVFDIITVPSGEGLVGSAAIIGRTAAR